MAWAVAALSLDLYGGAMEPRGAYDTVVVAGAGVMPDGTPSDALVARTDRAVRLWRQDWAPRLAFTGGVGDTPPAESVAAADLARASGVPEQVMLLEERSTSTEENARELRALIGDVRILVVTDRYHVFRCEAVFGRYFTDVDVVGVRSPILVRVRGAAREVAAVLWYTIRGRIGLLRLGR